MTLTIWILVFVVSLVAMVKGADWFLDSSEKIGLAAGLSPFVVGVVIVGLGTSFPELISSIAGVIRGVPEIVAANAIGSNIANILLVVGLSAVVGKKLSVTKNLIDLDLPLFAVATALFLGVVWDGSVVLTEAILLILAYGVYFAYTIWHKDDVEHETDRPDEIIDLIPAKKYRLKKKVAADALSHRAISLMDYVILIAGLAGLVLGAKYLVDAVISISGIVGIGVGVITLAAVALGTSLPELLVSVKAAWRKQSEIALGNIFGSNVFNLLIVVGVPGLFKALPLDEKTMKIGIPMLVTVSILFVISGISKTIHRWEGLMYLLVYVFFIGKLFELF